MVLICYNRCIRVYSVQILTYGAFGGASLRFDNP